jgi:hypothetical protein
MHGVSHVEHNNGDLYDEVRDVKAKIAELQYDLRRFLEHSNPGAYRGDVGLPHGPLKRRCRSLGPRR